MTAVYIYALQNGWAPNAYSWNTCKRFMASILLLYFVENWGKRMRQRFALTWIASHPFLNSQLVWFIGSAGSKENHQMIMNISSSLIVHFCASKGLEEDAKYDMHAA